MKKKAVVKKKKKVGYKLKVDDKATMYLEQLVANHFGLR